MIRSDVYVLGLLIWRIVLNGINPFDDTKLFPRSSTRKEHLTMLDQEKTKDVHFLGKTVQIVCERGLDVDQELIASIFHASIRTDEDDRDLDHIVDLLNSQPDR